MQFLREVLPNGLEIIAEITPSAISTSIGFFVKTGARDETPHEAGVSHFLEHMVFKGTESMTGEEINRRFDDIGAAANAFTSEEYTVYHAAVLPQQQRTTVELLAPLMRPALRESDFITEKLVILEEIRMYDDQPPFGADDRCRAAFFGSHPLASSVLGTVESIEALPVELMRDYHRRRYSPTNVVLVASGAVHFDDLVQSGKSLCGHWEPVDAPRRTLPAEPHGGLQHIVRTSGAQTYMVRFSSGPDGSHPLRHAAMLLANVLGDDSGSRLYWELIDSGEAEHAECHYHEYLDAGVFVTQVGCAPEDAADVQKRIEEIYARAMKHGIEPAELERARNKIATRVAMAGERPRQRLFQVGLEWSHSGRYRSASDDLTLVEQLTMNDIELVMATWPLDRLAMTLIAGPSGETVRRPFSSDGS